MSESAIEPRMSPDEYLVWERAQDEKHELHDGEVFAMAGGSPRHNKLSMAIGVALHNAVDARGCSVLSSDQRIAAEPGRYVYADVVVVCGAMQSEPTAGDVLVNPTIIVEVLSRSTEAHDRGLKWKAYQRIASLCDYLLVSQTQVWIEHFRREPDGSWRYLVYEAGDTIELASGASVAVDPIYAGAFEFSAGA